MGEVTIPKKNINKDIQAEKVREHPVLKYWLWKVKALLVSSKTYEIDFYPIKNKNGSPLKAEKDSVYSHLQFKNK